METTKSTLAPNTIAAIQQLQKQMAELTSQISEKRNKFLLKNPDDCTPEDIALQLVLHRMDITRGMPILEEASVNIILKSLSLPVFSEGNEIFACGFHTPEMSAYGRQIHWAALFKSNGFPELTFNKGSVGLTFPECDYRVFFITKDEGDFHLMHGCPTVELYTSPDSFDLPHPWRKVTKPGPFPASVLLDKIMTADSLKYSGLGSIVCTDNPAQHFIAAPRVHGMEGQHIVNRLRECLPEA
jgi:hypothetical protein